MECHQGLRTAWLLDWHQKVEIGSGWIICPNIGVSKYSNQMLTVCRSKIGSLCGFTKSNENVCWWYHIKNHTSDVTLKLKTIVFVNEEIGIFNHKHQKEVFKGNWNHQQKCPWNFNFLPVHAAQFQIPFTHRVFFIESRTLEDVLKWAHSIILPMETFGGWIYSW